MAALGNQIDEFMLSDLLGVAPNKVAVCTANSINMYSGEKPMRLNVTGIPTTAQKKAVNYGYVFPNYSTLTLIDILLLELYGVKPSGWSGHAGDANYRALMNEWYYAKPRGINYNEWYRNLDFAGYDHAAVSALLNTDITETYILNQSQTFFADIYQQQPAVMANFWEDSSHKKPMALDSFTYHAFGVAIASSGLTQARLQTATASAQCGQWCKYHIWPSPVKQENPHIDSADAYFLNAAGTYRIVPFIIGSNSPISARNNIGVSTLAEAGVIPLPCPYTSCVVTTSPTPSESLAIFGTPLFANNVPNVDFEWQISYTAGLQGAVVNYTIDEMDGSTVVRSWAGTTALNTSSGTYPRRASGSRSIRMSLSGYTYRLTISYSTYPSVSKNFREQITQ